MRVVINDGTKKVFAGGKKPSKKPTKKKGGLRLSAAGKRASKKASKKGGFSLAGRKRSTKRKSRVGGFSLAGRKRSTKRKSRVGGAKVKKTQGNIKSTGLMKAGAYPTVKQVPRSALKGGFALSGGLALSGGIGEKAIVPNGPNHYGYRYAKVKKPTKKKGGASVLSTIGKVASAARAVAPLAKYALPLLGLGKVSSDELKEAKLLAATEKKKLAASKKKFESLKKKYKSELKKKVAPNTDEYMYYMKLLENANDHLEALLKVANATDSNAETKAFDSAIEYLHSVANI